VQWLTRLAALTLLTTHGALALDVARRNSAVIDELGHIASGVACWQKAYFYLYHENPPLVRMLTALPVLAADPVTDYSRAQRGPGFRSEWSVGRDFMFANEGRYHELVCRARYVVVVLSVLGGWLLFRWSAHLFGNAGSLVATSLWAFNPNVLAHGSVATTDMGATVAGLVAAHAYWRYLHKPGLCRALAVGATLGVVLLTKFTMLCLIPVWIVTWILWMGNRESEMSDGRSSFGRVMRRGSHAAAVAGT
jgi:4-amino-4-deoxy-L-arabinose transferase-like glycosyltransferase